MSQLEANEASCRALSSSRWLPQRELPGGHVVPVPGKGSAGPGKRAVTTERFHIVPNSFQVTCQ